MPKIDELNQESASDQGGETDSLFKMELPPVSEQSLEYHDDAPADNYDESETDSENLSEPRAVESEEAEKMRGVVDDRGGAYDPAIHKYPPEKTPSTGRWKKKPKAAQEKTGAPVAENTNASVRLEAQKIAQLYATGHIIAFGDDGKPDDKNDVIMLVDSFERYFMVSGSPEIPPELDLILSCGMYTTKIVTRETNLQKCKKWGKKIWGALGFGKYAKDGGQNGAKK